MAGSSAGRRHQHGSDAAITSLDRPLAPPSSVALQAQLFRTLTWNASVPLCIRLSSDDLPAGADRIIDCLYIQAPRISYLSLLLPQIRRELLNLVIDEGEAALIKDDDLWFGITGSGDALKWHWPIGLIYDYAQQGNASRSPSPSPLPEGSGQPAAALHSDRQRSFTSDGVSSLGTASTASPLRQTATPTLDLTLHLANAPPDRLPHCASPETCKASFMNSLKEADFVRFGSTRRVTSLSRRDQDGLWDALLAHDAVAFWAVAGTKLVPGPARSAPAALRSAVGPGPRPGLGPGQGASTMSTFDASRVPDVTAVRSVPMRVYLPQGRPVMQGVVPAVRQDGSAQAQTLGGALSTLLPLLFPPARQQDAATSPQQERVRVVVQGIEVPLDAEIGWLSSVLSYPDGWLPIILRV